MLKKSIFSVLAVLSGLVLSCSGAPSLDTVKSCVISQIKMEGGKDIQFNSFEIERLSKNVSENSWRVQVKMEGAFVQNPHLDFDKAYEFNTVKNYEFVKSSKEGWRALTIGVKPLYKDPGSREVH